MFTESYRKIKSHILREDRGRAHHVRLKCKLFQVKELQEDLCPLLDAQSTEHQCLRKQSKVLSLTTESTTEGAGWGRNNTASFHSKDLPCRLLKGYDLTKHSSAHINNLVSFSPSHLSTLHTRLLLVDTCNIHLASKRKNLLVLS